VAPVTRPPLVALVMALALSAMAAGAQPAPAATGKLVAVQELENEMGLDYYTSFLVHLAGRPEPLEVDPKEWPLVRFDLPAGDYRVERIELYNDNSDSILSKTLRGSS
jgi:hypothetical protein